MGIIGSGFRVPIVTVVPAAPGIVPPDGAAYRGMFVWVTANPVQDPLATAQTRQDLLDFCVLHNINLLFLDMYNYISANNTSAEKQATVRSFIGAASALGIDVHALAGAIDWSDVATHGWITTNIAGGMDTYQASASASQKFKGFCLDVEYWTGVQAPADAIAGLDALYDILWRADLPIGHFVAFWLKDNTATRATLDYDGHTDQDGWFIMTYAANYIVVGSYYDEGLVQAQYTQAWYDMAEVAGGFPIYAAAETLDIGDTSSYFEEGSAAMETQLLLIAPTFPQTRTFKGVAVHSYDGWKVLGP